MFPLQPPPYVHPENCVEAFSEKRARNFAMCLIDPRILVFSQREYAPDGADTLALLRAVQGEVAPGATPEQKELDAARVAETLTNRFCYLRNRGYKPPLVTFVRNYAQPLSRRWANPEGELCTTHPERCTMPQMLRRAEHRTRTHFDACAVEAVRSALREGHVATTTSSIHFAMPGVCMSPEMIQLTPHVEHMNTFFATPDSTHNWKGYGTT